jgi:alginate O-acetyltransferase complex protein AlgI
VVPYRRQLFIIASWGIFDVTLFVGIAVANFFAAHAIARLGGRSRQVLLVVIIAADIAALALFKYSDFIGGNITAATGWPTPQLALGIPLAISFYTFHIISYLVDVHRKVVREASFRHYVFYLSFFPLSSPGRSCARGSSCPNCALRGMCAPISQSAYIS